MNKSILILIAVNLISFGCKEGDKPDDSQNLISDQSVTWITAPENSMVHPHKLTLGFDSLVYDHPIFQGFNYSLKPDSISFLNSSKKLTFYMTKEGENKMTIYNFMDGSITAVVKDVIYNRSVTR